MTSSTGSFSKKKKSTRRTSWMLSTKRVRFISQDNWVDIAKIMWIPGGQTRIISRIRCTPSVNSKTTWTEMSKERISLKSRNTKTWAIRTFSRLLRRPTRTPRRIRLRSSKISTISNNQPWCKQEAFKMAQEWATSTQVASLIKIKELWMWATLTKVEASRIWWIKARIHRPTPWEHHRPWMRTSISNNPLGWTSRTPSLWPRQTTPRSNKINKI